MKTWIATALMTLLSLAAVAEPISPRPEPLMGFMTSVHGVRIQAPSGGCTSKRSFAVKKEKYGAVTMLTFLRTESDLCLALYMYGVELSYTYQELGLEQGENFIIRNPMTFSKAR
jgi:hypothetical protein